MFGLKKGRKTDELVMNSWIVCGVWWSTLVVFGINWKSNAMEIEHENDGRYAQRGLESKF